VVELRDGSDMVYRAVSGSMAPHLGMRLPISGTMSGLCLMQQRALLCVDAGSDSRTDPELCRRLGIGSMALVPLQRAGDTIGIVKVVSQSTHAFDERHIQRVQLMAGQIAAAMTTAAEMEARKALLAERTRSLHLAQESELALREREGRYRAITETASDAIITVDETGIVAALNPAAKHMFGYSADELIGAKLTEIIPPNLREQHLQGFARYVSTGQRSMSWANVELTAVRKDGSEFPVEVSFTEYMQGKRRFFSAFMRDITKRKQVHLQLQQQALHDVLTDLPNRLLLHDRLNQGIADAQSRGEHMSLLFVDLDRFKEVNDTLGHEVGDQLLQEVARRLSAVVRTTDTVARLGGDEFAIVLPGSDMPGTDVIARKVTTALLEPIVLRGHMVGVGGSIGIAVFPTHGREASMLMRHADMAMYSAKRSGSGHAFYTPEHDEQRIHHLALTPDLRRAIEGDELELHYQPKVDLRSGTVSQVEALIRWHHPREGLVPPSRFIPHAEDTGLIEPLSVWTLKAALDQCRKWRDLGMNICVAVNLSSRNLHDRQLPEAISEAIRLAGVPAHGLEIEITETAIMLQPKRAADILGELHSLGVRVSIDDFGTGYSSLAYLKDFPVDEIKVDRSFVAGMGTHRKDGVIVQAIVDLGHNLGLEVVAEGVEDGASLNMLQEMGCDLAQGYYLSRPLHSADCSTWLAGHSSTRIGLLSARAHSA